MKRLFALPLACLCLSAAAQQTSGLIAYEQTISIDVGKSEGIPDALAEMLGKPQKTEKLLHFNTGAALYENKEKGDEDKEELSEGDMKISISRTMPEEKTYLNLETKALIEEKDLMGRKFLVTGTSNNHQWKTTGRQKKILDRACMEAVAGKGTEDSITVWYTPDIPVSAGPAGLSGLPGMILEASIGKHIHLLATGIEADPGGGKSIKEPTKGKKITGEEFARLAKEKEEEMKKQYGGGKGQVIIIK
ncbi:GLPGLI family protein [Taibaiella koreensis]|uniref:GLPGLI family protein n=1 Tax=Taibaiella koreensis TaxID=1268548 RepID=UPI000E59F90E|nr:GLPGLI family protein [Taibaiella koreensis]